MLLNKDKHLEVMNNAYNTITPVFYAYLAHIAVYTA